MVAQQRRKKIEQILHNASAPVSASKLAELCSVSRQIIVGDIALLRASGIGILATPRGYLLEKTPSDEQFTYSIACVHCPNQLQEEIYTILDCGGALIDVTVTHPVYGEICAPLHLFSRYDADLFLQKLHHTDARPLSSLTDGVHLHRIRCSSEQVYQRILDALQQRGILYQE